MMRIVSPAIEKYAERHSSSETALFRNLTRATFAKTSLPQMSVGNLEGLFLKFITRIARAKRVLEIGTFTGYSTLSMAEALPPGGNLVTLDIDPVNTRIARAFWKKSAAGRKIDLKLGPALATLKKLKGPFDLVFIDADKPNYWKYWNACLPLVRRGGLLLADNVLWSGRVLRPSNDRNDRAIAAFNEKVKRDRRVDIVMLPIRDGITLAIKK